MNTSTLPRKPSFHHVQRRPIPGSIGGVVQRQREAKRMSIQALAKATGLAPSILYELESQADRNPGFSTLVKVAKALDIPLSELVREWECEREGVA